MLNRIYYCFISLILFGDASKVNIFVLGGRNADTNEFPYVVSLRIDGQHKCGGSIINNIWILSAAHCLVKYDINKIIIVAGSNNLIDGGVAYHAAMIQIHYQYNPNGNIHDIGLVMVDGFIEFSESIQPIALPDKDIFKSQNYNTDGSLQQFTGIFTGWGTNTTLYGDNTNQLQVIKLNVIPLSLCQKTFPKVQREHLCTLNKPGEGVCYGDSGSPLVIDDIQVGISSWGAPCALGYPDIHTKVFNYVSWIESALMNHCTSQTLHQHKRT